MLGLPQRILNGHAAGQRMDALRARSEAVGSIWIASTPVFVPGCSAVLKLSSRPRFGRHAQVEATARIPRRSHRSWRGYRPSG